ncbi:MAG: type II toxin-antitoxin system PemK/MazF family toxin [Aminivibrio sp.]|jgi:mRNA interferase MazF|nr:type II toxin-antitoxin system PemK/MazF family toxin [Synergistaceae bacterium]
MNNPARGDVWQIDWSPSRGSEQGGMRPAVVVQTDAANKNPKYPNTIVCAISTKGRNIPFHVRLAPTRETGLSAPSFCKCEQLLTVSKDRLVRRLGKVGEETLEEIEAGVKLVLAL